jgi:hypothetical protein
MAWLRASLSLLAMLASTACRHDLGLLERPGANSDAGALADAASADAGRHEVSIDSSAADSGLPACLNGECCDAGAGNCGLCSAAHACPSERPICNDADGQCRACERDAECGASAVCIEDQGTCVADDGVAFVTTWGTDLGTCTRSAPCATLDFALGEAGKRKVLHVLGGSLAIYGTVTVQAGSGLVLDGEDTALNGTASTPLVIQGQTEITLEGFRINAVKAPDQSAIVVKGSAKARFVSVRFEGDGGQALSCADEARVTLHGVHVGSLTSTVPTEVSCAGGTLTVEQSTLESSIVSGNNGCALTIAQNRFESSSDGSVRMNNGGVLVMENNLVIHRDGYNDSVGVFNMYPGSTIRFNTFVNTTALSSDGGAISCDNTTLITSNVFAYNSAHPLTGMGCQTRYSVFDDVSQTSAGTGNQVAGIDTLFVDRAGGDYHLAKDSIARGAAEPGLFMVATDLERAARPTPRGTMSDSGAFEAP